MRQLYKWVEKESKRWQGETRHFQSNVACFSRGVALAASSHVRKIAAATPGHPDSQRRRLQRWLARPCDMPQFATNWTTSVMRRLPKQKTVYLLVDETKIENRFGVMVVGLAIEGRCIPLAWRSYIANSKADYPAEGQVAMILALLRAVQSGLKTRQRVVVMADRGISYSTSLVAGILEMGWHFLLRVPRDAVLVTSEGERIRFYHKVAQPNETFAATGTIFPSTGGIAAQVRTVRGQDAAEPWALITNVDDCTGWEYGQRMWIELAFRDLKSAGWQLEMSQLTCPHRFERLLILLVVAYCWMSLYGMHLDQHSTRMATRLTKKGTRVRRFSLFRQGRNAFLKALHPI